VTNSTAELASRDRGTATRVGAVLARIEAAFHRAVIHAFTHDSGQRAADEPAIRELVASAHAGAVGTAGPDSG
jgi:hypothetical protein